MVENFFNLNIAGKAVEDTGGEKRIRRAFDGLSIALRSSTHKKALDDVTVGGQKVGTDIKDAVVQALQKKLSEGTTKEGVFKTLNDEDSCNALCSGIEDNKEQIKAVFNSIKKQANIVASSSALMLFAGKITSRLSQLPLLGSVISGMNGWVRKIPLFGKSLGDMDVNNATNFATKGYAVFDVQKDAQPDAKRGTDREEIDNPDVSALANESGRKLTQEEKLKPLAGHPQQEEIKPVSEQPEELEIKSGPESIRDKDPVAALKELSPELNAFFSSEAFQEQYQKDDELKEYVKETYDEYESGSGCINEYLQDKDVEDLREIQLCYYAADQVKKLSNSEDTITNQLDCLLDRYTYQITIPKIMKEKGYVPDSLPTLETILKLDTILTEEERKECPILFDLMSSETFRQKWNVLHDHDKISARTQIKELAEDLERISKDSLLFMDMDIQSLESDIETHKENRDPDIWQQLSHAMDQEKYNHSMMRVKESQYNQSMDNTAKQMYSRMHRLYPNDEEFSEDVSEKQFSKEFIKTLAARYMTHFLKLPKVVHKADQPILLDETKKEKGSSISASSLSMMLRFQGNNDALSQKMTEHMAHLTELSVYQSNLVNYVVNGAQEQFLKEKCQKILERDGMMFLPILTDRHAMYGVLTRNAEGGLDFTMQNTWKGEGRLTATIRGGDDEERLTNIMHILRGSVKPSADYREGAKRMLETMTFGKVEDDFGRKAFGGKSINDILKNLQESETVLHTGQVQGNCHIIGLVHALGIAAELNKKRPESAPRIEGLTASTMKKDVQKLQYSDPNKAAKAFVRAVKRQTTPEARIERIEKTKEELDTVTKDLYELKGLKLRFVLRKRLEQHEEGHASDKIVGFLEKVNIQCSSLEAKKKKLEERLKTLEIRQKLSKLANRDDVKNIPKLRKELLSKRFEDLLKQDPKAYDSLEDYTIEALSKMMADTK